MNVAVAAVISVDGKLTRHDESNIYAWVSAEDQTHFSTLLDSHDVIVMGRGTYETVKDKIKLDPKKLRVVLTTHPENYQNQTVPDQLEFTSQSPDQLMTALAVRNFQNVLVVGASRIITDFLVEKLVDELYLTIEPRLFGAGQPLLINLPLDIKLQLTDYQQLNNRGTILLSYHIARK